jgi:hypothetical protein
VGFLLETLLVAASLPVLVPPVTLPITLVLIAVIVVAFAIPIRRAVRGRTMARIDPFRAVRIAMLAKACSLGGALLTGSGVGVLIYLLSRTVLPGPGAIWLAVVATIGAALLLTAGLVAEYLCTLPPDDEDKQSSTEDGHAPSDRH